MIDLVRALGALALITALGTLLDHLLRFTPASAARWPLRTLSALVLLYAYRVVPLLLVALLGAALLTRFAPPAKPEAPARPATGEPSRRDHVVIGAALLALVLGTMLRSPVALYWDEMVWLAKARVEAMEPGSLAAEALRVGTSTVPPGYPLFEPLSVSALAGYGTDTRALVFGAELLTLVAAATFMLTAVAGRHARSRANLAAAALACACPLVLVHLRSAYVDLELGLLAATLLLLLEARETRAAVVVALALVAMKDEGVAHLVAVSGVTIALAVVRARRHDALRAALVAIIGMASFGAWRIELVSSRVVDADHQLGAPSLGRIPDVLHRALAHAGDALGWGGLWAAVVGMLVAAVVRPATVGPTARARLLALASQVALLLCAILCSPERVMDFVDAGTLLPRLLVQLAPTAMLALAAGSASE